MHISLHFLLESTLIIAISVLWCEVGYYYFVFHFNCSSWPESGASSASSREDGGGSSKLTNFMIIADTHIMGPIKSAKIDKLRREWQMQQAFSISNRIFEPDVIVFMGDLLDEGSFSRDETFEKACSDFNRIFSFNHKEQELIIIPGNHDVGFHEQMKRFPYTLTRFSDKYESTSSIEIKRTPKTKHLNLIVSNSMSFYNDTCPYCSLSMALTRQIEQHLKRRREQNPKDYSEPIFLGHIPLYRKNDINCIYPDRIEEKVTKPNIEGEDVIHSAASEQILTRLRPRLALSGHTHTFCKTQHPDPSGESLNGFEEITVSSYNHKYAEYKPGFLLMSANSTHVFTKHCNLIEEWVVISVYAAALLTILFRLALARRISDTEDKVYLNSSPEEKE